MISKLISGREASTQPIVHSNYPIIMPKDEKLNNLKHLECLLSFSINFKSGGYRGTAPGGNGFTGRTVLRLGEFKSYGVGVAASYYFYGAVGNVPDGFGKAPEYYLV